MRAIAHPASIVAVAAALLLSACLHRTTRVRTYEQRPTLLTVADLIYQPNSYNRQEVVVEGWYRTGKQISVLQPGYSYHGGTAVWVYDENHEDEPTGPPQRDPSQRTEPELTAQELANQRALDASWGRTVHVVFEGEFRCGTGFGHLSQYRCALFLDRVLAIDR